MQHKTRFWLLTHFIISTILFLFSFSYWQDTGLGDNSKIPVGYGQTIQNEDFEWTYFYPNLSETEPNKDELAIEKYKIADYRICAEVSHRNSDTPSFNFIVYDLKAKTYLTFDSEKEYTKYADNNKLPLRPEFYDFKQHYREYIESRPGWRKWLLP